SSLEDFSIRLSLFSSVMVPTLLSVFIIDDARDRSPYHQDITGIYPGAELRTLAVRHPCQGMQSATTDSPFPASVLSIMA
ncbi:MAG: hypothetical protein QME89_09595, partial [Actinomycetota bacterium]|nr:hypothetical protein [Actinomycetota bacterium]